MRLLVWFRQRVFVSEVANRDGLHSLEGVVEYVGLFGWFREDYCRAGIGERWLCSGWGFMALWENEGSRVGACSAEV